MSDRTDYWNNAAQDDQVDLLYISDLDTPLPEFRAPVLEIGCGVGRLLKPGYCGIDISNNMLEICRKRKDNEVRLTFPTHIPYPNETFNSVYSVLVFQHIPTDEVKAYLNESYRVLYPSGDLFFQTVLNADSGLVSFNHDLEELILHLQGLNFQNIKISVGDWHSHHVIFTANKPK